MVLVCVCYFDGVCQSSHNSTTVLQNRGEWKQSSTRSGMNIYNHTLHTYYIGIYMIYVLCAHTDKERTRQIVFCFSLIFVLNVFIFVMFFVAVHFFFFFAFSSYWFFLVLFSRSVYCTVLHLPSFSTYIYYTYELW